MLFVVAIGVRDAGNNKKLTHISVSTINVSSRQLQNGYNIAVLVCCGHQERSGARIIRTIGILTCSKKRVLLL